MFERPLWSIQTQAIHTACIRHFVVAAFLVALATQAFAALGGDVSSIQNDQAHIAATRRVTQAEGYNVHELRSPAGAVVREFESSGKVFAISWQSPSLPDLKQLLAARFQEFQQAAQQHSQPGGHAPLIIHLPDLVVELGGHMRGFVGRAYLPGDMPTNVHSADLH